ncbi:molybdate transport system permease protein [Paenibacillus shirakamiensis]|uniref:Molybdenum transport system permease n=1 Tax=Paenibacillus shirakamiensis TaxID=1265935 RepID=A0ABS4JKE8_9BACL|nr:molybdate ABC transporter permease subunit [Paenibacillus shirakamiensis]MBP2002173.1 molybdate transport system permease protein [Paenibacillus shirakamiensis]
MDEVWAPAFWQPIFLSIKVSLLAGFLSFLLAILIGWGIHGRRFKGRTLLETLFMLPLVLPPTVVGFLLLVLLGRRSWVGEMFEKLFGLPIVFTWGAGVIAASVVAFPLAFQTIKNGFSSIDKDLIAAGRSLGASEFQLLRYVMIPLAYRSLVTGFVLACARALGEFGATLMLAGNIPGRTQTLPTAIYMAVDANDMKQAWIWAGSMVLISFILLWCTRSRAEVE